VYNYLWLLVKALAIKKCMFTDFQDYDMYAFYAANRLFFALRKNQLNQGKTIKGKLIRPIKSCLNYTKALLYPMKIEYQRESFKEVIEEEFVSKKFDAFAYKEQLKDRARDCAGVTQQFREHLQETLSKNSLILDKVLQKSPFNKDTTEYQNLKISILLNSIQILKTKKKLEVANQSIILWHMPKSMANYTKILLKEFFMELKLEIMDCYKASDISDMELEHILDSAPEALYNEEQY
jgi:actin-related protein